ncbi:MAG: 4'-phosphopantetheinyl transferase superfamily protein [Planctomycetaceae bacterium]|jgi:4'-phosphopantetheinyl transferase|nr:4'-phosphopantetheinyl transferase superfamily protein [Planctomycetaceae bacterium]
METSFYYGGWDAHIPMKEPFVTGYVQQKTEAENRNRMKQVYHTEISHLTEEHFQQMLHEVPEFRRQHALSYRNRNDTILCLAAYQLLKQALGTKDNPVFYRNNFGKPYLTELLDAGTPPFFNISHTHGLAVCVIADTEIGIDVETPFAFDADLAEVICTPNELQTLEQLSINEKTTMLNRLWVQKESYLKAIGKGLLLEPKSIEIVKVTDYDLYVNDNFFGRFLAVCQQQQRKSH